MIRPKAAAFLLFPLLAAALTAAGAAGSEAHRDLLLRQFAAVAFSSEIGGADRRGRLLKWRGPIVPHVLAAPDLETETRAWDLVFSYAATAKLPVTSLGEANFVIRFVTPRTLFDAAGRRAPCYTRVDHGADGVIARADVYIVPREPDQVRHCLAEEIFQGFGLVNDSDLIPGSLLHDSGARPDAAWQDMVLLRVLYHPVLEAGMAAEEALPLAAEVLEGVGR